MNLFSKKYIIIVLLFLLLPRFSFAINIYGLYVSSCKRELGVILKVEQAKIQLLTLQGEFKEIPRHEIIYLTYYSIDSFPGLDLGNNQLEDIVQVDTVQNNEIVKLVEGWPIDYSESDISFLTLEGQEVVIARENIWKIKIKKINQAIVFKNSNNGGYQFEHPYPFRLCPAINSEYEKSKTKPVIVYPQQMLNDSVQIKIELDRLQESRKRVLKYSVYQQFYAVPQVFKNNTSLGYWISYGSRYGASKSRNNNLTPILQNEFSSGIFGYQHLLLTGSAPMPYSVHEEIQTQLYYRFKADYFHMGVMLDPNMFLIPWEKYRWKAADINRLDDAVNPNFSLEIGLDYGNLAAQWHFDALNMGVRCGEYGYYGNAVSNRFSLSYQNHIFKAGLQYDPFSFIKNRFTKAEEEFVAIGEVIDVENQIGVVRFNFETSYYRDINIRYSFIYRSTKVNKTFNSFKAGDDFIAGDEVKNRLFSYKSGSFTNALYVVKSFKSKYSLGGFAALEYHKAERAAFHGREEESKVYPKGGVYASLFF